MLFELLFKMFVDGLIATLEKNGKEFVEITPNQFDNLALEALLIFLKTLKV